MKKSVDRILDIKITREKKPEILKKIMEIYQVTIPTISIEDGTFVSWNEIYFDSKDIAYDVAATYDDLIGTPINKEFIARAKLVEKLIEKHAIRIFKLQSTF